MLLQFDVNEQRGLTSPRESVLTCATLSLPQILAQSERSLGHLIEAFGSCSSYNSHQVPDSNIMF